MQQQLCLVFRLTYDVSICYSLNEEQTSFILTHNPSCCGLKIVRMCVRACAILILLPFPFCTIQLENEVEIRVS